MQGMIESSLESFINSSLEGSTDMPLTGYAPSPESGRFQSLASSKGVSATSFDYALPTDPTSFVLHEIINGEDGTAAGNGFTANGGVATGNEMGFDGSTDRIELTTLGNAGSVLDDGVVVIGWVRPDANVIDQSWISMFRSGETAILIRLNDTAAGEVGGSIISSGASRILSFTATGMPIGDGEWHYVILSINPITEDRLLTVDGKEYSITISSNAFPSGTASNFTVGHYIGANNSPSGANRFVTGSLRPPKLMFGATLTEAEANALWAAAVGNAIISRGVF